jgi:uncharacterized membrane protein YdbT with pleckstrin-like domain
MRYIENNLLQNEKLVYSVSPHWVVFSSAVWAIVFGFLVWIFGSPTLSITVYANWSLREMIAVFLVLLGCYWFVRALIYYNTSEYGVTNKRVLIKVGWIERNSLELLLDKVEGVLVDQSIMGRIFNYGWINVIGTGGTNDRFPFIPDPQLFRKTVQQQIELYEEHMHGTSS